jgi:hypothetical protein
MVLDCTTLARVQARLPQTDAGSNAIISTLITSVSAAFERETYRHFLTTDRVEVYPLRPPARVISLKGSPATVTDSRGVSTTAFTVKVSTSQSFSGAVSLTRNTNYVVEQDRGVLRILDNLETFTGGALGRSICPAYVQVSYTGGLAADTATLISTYPELAGACDEQVVYEFTRRSKLGASDYSIGESIATHSDDVNLLAGVRRVLARFKRRGG